MASDSTTDRPAALRRFRDDVAELADLAEGWAAADGWATKRYPKRMQPAGGELFEVDTVMMQRGPAKILLDPVGLDAAGRDAVVDLYLMPDYDDLASLYRDGGGWRLYRGDFDGEDGFVSPKDRPSRPLDQDAFCRTIEEIGARQLSPV